MNFPPIIFIKEDADKLVVDKNDPVRSWAYYRKFEVNTLYRALKEIMNNHSSNAHAIAGRALDKFNDETGKYNGM